MSTLLPVLASQSPKMSLCEVCPKPGHCCTRFILTGGDVTFWYKRESWKEDAQKDLEANGFPFFFASEIASESGAEVKPFFSCTKLVDGRCSIYEDRPQLCRLYAPGSDELCVLHHPLGRLNPQ